MVTKTRAKAKVKGNEYRVVSGGKVKIVTARNIKEADAKARRLFPKSKQILVSRKPAETGREYETYIISR